MTALSGFASTFRTVYQAELVDTCTITRTASRGTLNVSTGEYTGGSTSTVYGPDGVCLLRPGSTEVTEQDTQERRDTIDLTVYLPHTATGVEVEDTVTITGTSKDPELVGKILRVGSVEIDSHGVRRVLTCTWDMGPGSEPA